ncbi:MAG: lytic transglycosylase domain-containing protein [Clostridia bacterium]|nr:lytic transglycosylase domain-containing protein [Clostridia bacterium]
MKKRRGGCLRPIIFILLAVFLLYFTVGNGKTFILKKLYPIEYQEAVERYAEEYSLDRYLVYAVIKVESGFNENAVSVAGAKGLMQLMETTAQDCNSKADFGYTIPDDLFVAEHNIRLGCYYLRQLLDNYGDIKLAITAYNGGTGNVDKWLKDKTLADGKGGLSDIPYSETKRYVKKVIKAYETYNNLYKYNNI